jgi:hypothetical protein
MYTNTLDYSRTHFIEIQNTLSTGVYYVKINIGSKEITKKIVIE